MAVSLDQVPVGTLVRVVDGGGSMVMGLEPGMLLRVLRLSDRGSMLVSGHSGEYLSLNHELTRSVQVQLEELTAA
ncbi:MAG: hypothetical protein RLZZ511_1073 [Cyanobacteriota bacterium]